MSRTSDPDADGSLQGFGNRRKHSPIEMSVSWEEIAVKKSLEVREALDRYKRSTHANAIGAEDSTGPTPGPYQSLFAAHQQQQ